MLGKVIFQVLFLFVLTPLAFGVACELEEPTTPLKAALGSCGASNLSVTFPGGETSTLDLNSDGTVDANIIGNFDIQIGTYEVQGDDTLTITLDENMNEKMSNELGQLIEGFDWKINKVQFVFIFTCGGGIEVHVIVSGPTTPTTGGTGGGNLTMNLGGFAADPDGPGGVPPTITGGTSITVESDPNPEEDGDEKKEKADLGDEWDGIKIKFAPHCKRAKLHVGFFEELLGN